MCTSLEHIQFQAPHSALHAPELTSQPLLRQATSNNGGKCNAFAKHLLSNFNNRAHSYGTCKFRASNSRIHYWVNITLEKCMFHLQLFILKGDCGHYLSQLGSLLVLIFSPTQGVETSPGIPQPGNTIHQSNYIFAGRVPPSPTRTEYKALKSSHSPPKTPPSLKPTHYIYSKGGLHLVTKRKVH